MIEITCKYAKLMCCYGYECKWKHDDFQLCDCEDYRAKSHGELIVEENGKKYRLYDDNCVNGTAFSDAFIHKSVRKFDYDEDDEIVSIGGKEILKGSIEYLIVRIGNREEWLIGEKEEE